MVWLYSEPDRVVPEGVVVPPPPPPPPACGGNAPARGKGVLANEGFALSSDANVDEWLHQVPGSRRYPIGTSDVRKRDAQCDPNLMDTFRS